MEFVPNKQTRDLKGLPERIFNKCVKSIIFDIVAKAKYNGNRQYTQDPYEIERTLITRIADTGKEQLKRRRKAGLSSFYAREGKIIEVLPNNSEHVRHAVKSKWVVLTKEKRSFKLK